jgi:hypothetical protein
MNVTALTVKRKKRTAETSPALQTTAAPMAKMPSSDELPATARPPPTNWLH